MKKLLILIAIVSLIVLACKKEPKVESSNFSITNEEIVIGTTSVAVTVTYSYPSTLERVDGYISVNNDMSNANRVHATINQNTFALRFNDLQANTHYYYHYEYSTGVDTYKTDICSFTTNDYATPMVETVDVTNITALSAQCGGEVVDDGGMAVTARGICWSNNTNPTIDDSHTSNGTGSGSFTSNMTDLAVSTKYYVRAYATNSKGTSYGNTKEFTTTDGKPTVITNEVTDITATSAKCGGNITDDGGFAITARGVCWSTNENPTINDSHTNDGTGSGMFIAVLDGLNEYTTYYARAYAKNEIRTVYGSQISFTTCIDSPIGAIGGLFSIAETQTVYFSQGNLQYQASTNNWRFADHQFDYIGDNNINISSTYNGWIDLFGWGTGTNPTESSSVDDHYRIFSDWGINPISNGGNSANLWRTLTKDEWVYLFETRNTGSGIRYAKAIVNGKNGVILLPDQWTNELYVINNANQSDAIYSSNIISSSIWLNNFEQHGAVFLPAAGYRGKVYSTYSIYEVGIGGNYWSSTSYPYTGYYGYRLGFNDINFYPDSSIGRSFGLSVRLVQDH